MTQGLEETGIITFTGNNPEGHIDLPLAPANTGKAKLSKVKVTMIHSAGPAYTVNTTDVEVFNKKWVSVTDPADDGDNTIYRNVDNEPNSVLTGGKVINDSNFQPTAWENNTISQNGYVSVRMVATGGNVNSLRRFRVTVYGDVLN